MKKYVKEEIIPLYSSYTKENLMHNRFVKDDLKAGMCTVNNMKFYQKVPGLGQKRNVGLTYSILADIYFKIVPLGMCTGIPSFFPCFKSTMEVIFLNAVPLVIPFGCQTVSKRRPFSFILNLGSKAKSQGAKSSE
jgi:hypothetical protein